MAIVVREAIETDLSREGEGTETSPVHRVDEALHRGSRTRVALREQPPEDGAVRNGDGLVASYRELSSFADRSSILESIPRLAIGVCGARGAQLLEIRADRTTAIVATHGVSLRTQTEEITRRVCLTLDVHPTLDAYPKAADGDPAAQSVHATAQPLVAISIPGGGTTRLLLVLERGPGATFSPEEIRHLDIFAFVLSTALARAQSDAALQASQAIGAAVVEVIHEAVIAFDANGVVRALSASAAILIGRRSNDVVGQHLRDLPGMGPLGLALQGARWPDTVKLSIGEATVRLRRCEGGLAVALLAPPAGTPRIGGAHFHLDDLLGASPAILRARETAQRVADSHLSILLTGETGTGKEILAQAIHNLSVRAQAPFVAVNVAAIPRELLESELFGYDGGAFTGASAQGHPGQFELARNGTLLLDEIGDLPVEMQAKLLRILQERVVHRLGASRAWAFTARVIASTNRDLEHEVNKGRFRLDLLHRLRVVHIDLPPLRDRSDDVRLLIAHQLRLLAQRTGRAAIHLAPQVMAALETYSWPGNVRELVNMLECEVSLLPPGKDVIEVVPEAIERSMHRVGAALGGGESMTLECAEREACIRALQKTGGNVARAAHVLGVAKATLYSKIRRYGIARQAVERAASRHRGPATSDR